MAQLFKEAFVEEVIIDIDKIDLLARENDHVSILPDDLLKAPHNSLIVRILKGQVKKQVVAYPLFPPHVLMPIKVSDHVWTVRLGGRVYWICKKNQNSEIDDLAATYPERAEGALPEDDETAEQHNRAATEECILPRTNSSVPTIYPNDETEELNFHEILKEKRKYISEVVPRFKKRPGDLVFQGSNNSLISLGSDRGFKKEDTIDPTSPSSATDEPTSYSGTIDLVGGRGRYLPKSPTTSSAIGHKPLRTAPPTIENPYGETEVDKDPIANEIEESANRSEGDPDFGFDASRIYISSKTNVDENFSLIENYPPIPAVITAETGTVPKAVEAAAITLKSDEIRIIARKHIAEDYFADVGSGKNTASANASDVNGSIKIIKEGTRDGDHSTIDGNGAAVIMIQPDGTIMIDGPTIVIGTGRETSNGAGDQVFIGSGASEPIVLGNMLKTLLKNHFDALTIMLKKYDTHFHPTGVGPSGPPTITGDDAGCGPAIDSLDTFLSKVGKTK